LSPFFPTGTTFFGLRLTGAGLALSDSIASMGSPSPSSSSSDLGSGSGSAAREARVTVAASARVSVGSLLGAERWRTERRTVVDVHHGAQILFGLRLRHCFALALAGGLRRVVLVIRQNHALPDTHRRGLGLRDRFTSGLCDSLFLFFF
jgi:hypothetical protein